MMIVTFYSPTVEINRKTFHDNLVKGILKHINKCFTFKLFN